LRHAANYGQHWRVVTLPAVAGENDALGRQPGEALWPEMYSAERLEKIRIGRTAYYWQALYQQNPQAEGGAEWPESVFGPGIWFSEWPNAWHCKTVALDPSKGTDAKFGDYSAFALLMFAQDGNLYVDADLGIRNTSVIVDTALEIYTRFRPDCLAVEVNQFQQLLADELRHVSTQRGLLLPLYTLDNRVNKQVRIRRLTPYLMQGRLRFKGDSPGARLLVEQLRDFPHGDHDDGPDALEMAVRMADEFLIMCQSENDLIELARAF
jgi:predicted phage terminase large subunit-like protein